MAQIIIDYENPIKKLCEDFSAYNRVCVVLFILSIVYMVIKQQNILILF